MDRPVSIVNFERCYLGAYAIGMVNTALSWSATKERMVMMQQPGWILPAGTALGFMITLAIWYFAARRGSAVAKWVAAVFAGLAIVGLLIAIPMGTYPKGINGVLGVVTTVLQLVGVRLLFRPDTREWFGESKGNTAT